MRGEGRRILKRNTRGCISRSRGRRIIRGLDRTGPLVAKSPLLSKTPWAPKAECENRRVHKYLYIPEVHLWDGPNLP